MHHTFFVSIHCMFMMKWPGSSLNIIAIGVTSLTASDVKLHNIHSFIIQHMIAKMNGRAGTKKAKVHTGELFGFAADLLND